MGAIYKIGSFNTHNLSLGSHRDIERIAMIIKQNDLDIIALQEVLSDGKRITDLMRYLGFNWAYSVKKPDNHQTSKYPYSRNDTREESYAFIWNTKRIELPVINPKRDNPDILENYHLREQGLIRLIRDPLVGRFKLKNRDVEIRLITTHIIFGKPQNSSVPIDSSALTLRRNEFKVLAGDIYARVNDDHKNMDSTVPYTIILGDYNLNHPKSGIKKDNLIDEIFFDKNGISTKDSTKADRVIYTVQSDLTTLQTDKDGNAKSDYANNYDHFSFEERVRKDVYSGCYAIDAVHGNTAIMSSKPHIVSNQQPSNSNNPFDIYLKDVSDHLPIVIELNI